MKIIRNLATVVVLTSCFSAGNALLQTALAQTVADQTVADQTVLAQTDESDSTTAMDEEKQSQSFMHEMLKPAQDPAEPNTMMRSISREAKMNAAQSFMAVNPFSLRDMVNMMTHKIKVDDGLSIDDVIESMNLRANLLNFRMVGHNTPWKIMESISGEPMPKVEIVSYCDVMTMRKILDYSPEFVALLPCRIAVIEDSAGDLWVVTLDWDVRWLDTSPNPNKMSDELREEAIAIRENIHSIMEAGAYGEL